MSALVAGLHKGPIEDLLAEWTELFAKDPEATPFASPTWAVAWWRHWGADVDLWIVTVRNSAGELVGLAPLVRTWRGPVRTLRGLGSGVGNYWDVIAPSALRAEVQEACAMQMAVASGQWDLFHVDRLPPGSTTPAALSKAGLRVRDRFSVRAPWLTLPSAFDEYLAGLSASRRSKVGRHLRPLDNGEIEVAGVNHPDEIARAVRRWQELRVAWWASRDRPINPEHAAERFRAFTTDAVQGLVAEGLALVREFRKDGEVIGVAIDFVDDRTMYYWLNGFDPRFEKLRLGHAFIASGIRSAIERGLKGYDFMIGTESYKYDYGSEDRVLGGVMVSNSRMRSRCAAAARALKNRVRKPSDHHS